MGEPPISEAFYEAVNAIASLVTERPLPRGISTIETDKWNLAVNTTGEAIEWEGPHCGAMIAPHSVVAIHKEFVCISVLNAGGGAIGGGMSEDQFIKEMREISESVPS